MHRIDPWLIASVLSKTAVLVALSLLPAGLPVKTFAGLLAVVGLLVVAGCIVTRSSGDALLRYAVNGMRPWHVFLYPGATNKHLKQLDWMLRAAIPVALIVVGSIWPALIYLAGSVSLYLLRQAASRHLRSLVECQSSHR